MKEKEKKEKLVGEEIVASMEAYPSSGFENIMHEIASNRISKEELSKIARQGLPRNTIQKVIEQEYTSLGDVASVLGVAERTLRTYQNQTEVLSPQQGELLLKYQRLLHRGRQVIGSAEAFHRWLRKPSFGLDGDKPIDLLVTSEGINLVSDEVERIANGEFA